MEDSKGNIQLRTRGLRVKETLRNSNREREL